MSTTFLVFNLQLTCSVILVGLVARWFVLPRLRAMDPTEALTIPLLVGATRYMGLMFLVPTVAPGMPMEFATVAGYGDAASAALALVAAIACHARSPMGRMLAWAYVVLGGGDLALGFAQGFRYELWDHLAGAWTYIAFAAPSVIVALGTTVLLLVRPTARPT